MLAIILVCFRWRISFQAKVIATALTGRVGLQGVGGKEEAVVRRA